MCYLSCLLLHQLRPATPLSEVSYQLVSDLHHGEFPRASKTVVAVKRRLHFLFKKREGLLSDIAICMEECRLDLVGVVRRL